MITPLTEPLNSFPHFMPNQVLTHTQLNELAVYLEQQDRFTRQRLIGIGIVCGLQANLIVSGNSRTVEISRGVGITSCGFLIDISEKMVFTKKKDYTTPSDYWPFLLGPNPGAPIDCIELKPDDSTESGISNLSANHVSNKIVVLFLDLEDKPNGKCIGENCDEKGNKWLFTLRVLLIDKPKIDSVLIKTYTPNIFSNTLNTNALRDNFFNPEYQLPTVFVERFGNVNNNPATDFNLDTITTYADFEKNYEEIIAKSSVRIGNAIHKTYNLFKPIFDTQLLTGSNPFSGYQNPLSTNSLASALLELTDETVAGYKKGSCQYVYDFLRDLKATYSELRDELFALASECSPDPTPFPRHLMLGELKATDFGKFVQEDFAPPTVYRHHFNSSRIINHQSKHLRQAKCLIERLWMQINALTFSNLLESSLDSEAIIVTPDKTCCAPLGEQRIPFYYNIEGSKMLLQYWHFPYSIQNRIFENRSYFMEDLVPASLPADQQAYDKYPILFDTCGFPKLSIEGHVGKDLESAINELKALRKKYNLSFDILALKLDKQLNQVAIADDNLFADLQAQYGVERNELICCLQELADYIDEHKGSLVLFFALMFYVLTETQPNTALLTYLSALLDAYYDSILVMIESLPADIKDFDFVSLYTIFPVFSSFTTLFKYIVNTWGDVEFFLINKDQSPLWVYADLISVYLNIWEMYLDKVGDDCILGKFYTIYRAFYDRTETFTLFHKFNESVHGMEHIAGTSKGGTFILVYEDQEDQKEFFGQVVDLKGKGLEGVMIVDSKNPKLVYGVTDSKGIYEVKIPAKSSTVRIMKPGYVAMEMKATPVTKKGAKSVRVQPVKLATYCDAASGKKAEMSRMKGSDKVYVSLKHNYDNIIKADKNYAAAAEFVNLDLTFKAPAAPFKIENKKSFRVVADFYLPHLIHNYKTAVEPIEACEELSEIKLVDYNSISEALAKQLGKNPDRTVSNMFKNAKARG